MLVILFVAQKVRLNMDHTRDFRKKTHTRDFREKNKLEILEKKNHNWDFLLKLLTLGFQIAHITTLLSPGFLNIRKLKTTF